LTASYPSPSLPQALHELRSPLVQAAVEALAVVVAEAHHEDEVDSATVVDVEDPEEDSAEAAVAAVASQEAVVVASRAVDLAAAAALADVDVEATKLVGVVLKPRVCARP
jgi:hypothetical protein